MTQMPPLALLAGGLAKRLRPLSERIAKGMIEVAGEPFIAHQLRLLRRESITHVVLCVGHLGQQFEDFVGDGSQYGLSVEYCYDGDTLLGTGGALRRALGQLGAEFLVMYGDSWLDASFAPVVEAFRSCGKSALMTVYGNFDRWDRSNVWFEGGRILAYDKEKRLPQMRHIDWGLSMTKADVLAAGPTDQPIDLATIYSALAQKDELSGYEMSTRFYEIGSLEGLHETDELLRRNFHVADAKLQRCKPRQD
jgi:NDP-sugar pyrophosphorylase family protein